MNYKNPPFLNNLTGAKNPNINPNIITIIIYFIDNLDDDLDYLIAGVVLGIDYIYLSYFYNVFYLFI